MKKYLILFFLLLITLFVNAQEIDPIQVTVGRSSECISQKGYNTVERIKKGETLTLYYPIDINVYTGKLINPSRAFNYIVLDSKWDENTPIIHVLLENHLDNDNRIKLKNWIKRHYDAGRLAIRQQQDSLIQMTQTATTSKSDDLVPILEDKNSVETKQSQMQLSMQLLGRKSCWHDDLTIFTGELEFNFSHQRLLNFLDKNLLMVEKTQDYNNGYIVSQLKEKTSRGTPKTLTFTYKVRETGHYFMVDELNIKGSYTSVVKLFASYWPTSLQFDDIRRGEWVYCYMMPDRIGLFVDKQGNASIKITNSQKSANR